MFLTALVAFIGSRRWPSRLWNVTMLCAHMAPLSVIVIARNIFAATNSELFLYLGLAIHIPLIGLEMFAILWRNPSFGSIQRTHVRAKLPSAHTGAAPTPTTPSARTRDMMTG
jgi:hypothetical protein